MRRKAEKLLRSLYYDKKTEFEEVDIELPAIPMLIKIGDAYDITYETNKLNARKKELFKHEFSKSKPPELFTNPDRNILIIVGGNLKVKGKGITG